MKTTLVALCLLCTTLAFGQALGGSLLSSETQVLQISGHPARAMHQPMAEQQSLLESSTSVSAKGERPLWEVGKTAEPMPLGDVARLLKKQHETVKKAAVVFEN